MAQNGEKGHGRKRRGIIGAGEVCSRNMMLRYPESALQNGERGAGDREEVSQGRTSVSRTPHGALPFGSFSPFGWIIFPGTVPGVMPGGLGAHALPNGDSSAAPKRASRRRFYNSFRIISKFFGLTSSIHEILLPVHTTHQLEMTTSGRKVLCKRILRGEILSRRILSREQNSTRRRPPCPGGQGFCHGLKRSVGDLVGH